MAQLGERWRNQEEMWLSEDKMWLNGSVPDRDAVVPGSNSAPPYTHGKLCESLNVLASAGRRRCKTYTKS
jgi:hypothetical protein